MAKIAFTKLGLSVNKEIKEIEWNDQKIEVKQYLPSNDKLQLCSNIINESVDSNNYFNPGRVAIFLTNEIIMTYTNINVTEKQQEDPCKLFDLFNNGFAQAIFAAIPANEIESITQIVDETIENIYKYRNSVFGILDTINSDYSDLNFDATNIQEQLSKGENIEFLKDVMTKLG